MPRILAVGSHATDDPTKSSLPFITAAGALDAGRDVAIALVGEAAYLAKEAIRKNVHGVGFPALTDVVDKVVSAKVPVYV